MENDDDTTTVYQYFACNGALIYVGITNRGTKRLHEHADSKPWWTLATGCTLEHFDSRSAALDRERYLIETYRPPYNEQHNPDRHIPRDERAKSRLRAGAHRVVVSGDIKSRREKWYSLTPEQKLSATCVRCHQRPGLTGPECLNCRQLKTNKKGLGPLSASTSPEPSA